MAAFTAPQSIHRPVRTCSPSRRRIRTMRLWLPAAARSLRRQMPERHGTNYKRKQATRSKRAARDLAKLASARQASPGRDISTETVSVRPALEKHRDDTRRGPMPEVRGTCVQGRAELRVKPMRLKKVIVCFTTQGTQTRTAARSARNATGSCTSCSTASRSPMRIF